MKRSIDEDNIRRKINNFESTNDEADIDTDLLWAELKTKINAKPVKQLYPLFYWAAAILLITIIVIGMQTGEKNSKQIDEPISNVLKPQHMAPMKNKPKNVPENKQKQLTEKLKPIPEIAVSAHHYHKKTDNSPVAERAIEEDDDAFHKIENYGPLGLYATPVVQVACSNTRIEEGLLCY